MDRTPTADDARRQAPRKPYRPPRLAEYGSVSARTLGGPIGSIPDFMGGLQMIGMCY